MIQIPATDMAQVAWLNNISSALAPPPSQKEQLTEAGYLIAFSSQSPKRVYRVFADGLTVAYAEATLLEGLSFPLVESLVPSKVAPFLIQALIEADESQFLRLAASISLNEESIRRRSLE
jgi:hypothetical protein